MLPLVANAETVMSRCMNSWVGYTIDDVINKWGYPTSEKELAGKKLYYWDSHQSYVTGNQYYVTGGEIYFIRIFEVDKNNKVIKWEYKGNNCPKTYLTCKKWINPENDPWKIKKEQKKLIRENNKKSKEVLK